MLRFIIRPKPTKAQANDPTTTEPIAKISILLLPLLRKPSCLKVPGAPLFETSQVVLYDKAIYHKLQDK